MLNEFLPPEIDPKQVLPPLMFQRLSKLPLDQTFMTYEGTDIAGDFDKYYDLLDTITLARIYNQMGFTLNLWDSQVNARRQHYHRIFSGENDYPMIMELYGLFCKHLINKHRYFRVSQIIQRIGVQNKIDDYLNDALPEEADRPEMRQLVSGQLTEKYRQIVIDVASDLVTAGQLNKANRLIGTINIDIQGLDYYNSLLEFYTKHHNRSAIEALLRASERRIGELNELGYDPRMHQAVIIAATRALVRLDLTENNLMSAQTLTDSIFPLPLQLIQQAENIRYLARNNQPARVEDFVTRFHEALDAGSSGSSYLLAAAGVDEPLPGDQISPADRIRLLATLASVLGPHREYYDLYLACLTNDGPAGRTGGIIDILPLLPSARLLDLWPRIFAVHADAKDIDGLEHSYQLALSLTSGYTDLLTAAYVEHLTRFQPEAAYYLAAEIGNPELKLEAFAGHLVTRSQYFDTLKSWRYYFAEFEKQEIAIMGEPDTGTLNITDLADFLTGPGLDQASLEEPPPISSLYDQYSRPTSRLLGNLAKAAVIRRNYAVFNELIHHDKLNPHDLVNLMSEVADYLINNQPLEMWY